ncbi:39200_t:CDS:2 [Gigaspora margarita]|uniref:39200_t:CDS:1 n=1 Tax=Gigaspora margarita TaxID=4874 RepID=A0ABN7V894_GIGMA|nr:39200_t:CDS:2 [Gigaspora margarita]
MPSRASTSNQSGGSTSNTSRTSVPDSMIQPIVADLQLAWSVTILTRYSNNVI